MIKVRYNWIMKIIHTFKCQEHGTNLEQSKVTSTSFICHQCKSIGKKWLFDITELEPSNQIKSVKESVIYLNHELWINPGTVIKSLQIVLNYTLDDAIDLVHNAANNGRIELTIPKNKSLTFIKKELDDFIYDDLEKYYPNLFSIE